MPQSEEFLTTSDEVKSLEEWTLAELLGQVRHSPRAIVSAFIGVLRDQSNQRLEMPASAMEAVNTSTTSQSWFGMQGEDLSLRRIKPITWQFFGYLLAFAIVLYGNSILINAEVRTEARALTVGAPIMLFGFVVWLLTEAFAHWNEIRHWVTPKDRPDWVRLGIKTIPGILIVLGILSLVRSFDLSDDDLTTAVQVGGIFFGLGVLTWMAFRIGYFWQARRLNAEGGKSNHQIRRRASISDSLASLSSRRVFFATIGVFLIILTWLGTAGNHIPTLVFYYWIVGIIAWSIALAPHEWNPLTTFRNWGGRVREFRLQGYWRLIVAVVIILCIGAYFRLHQLAEVPPEMTSDHVEKLLDAKRVLEGDRDIFFANNGGREPFQMYAMALFSQLPGMGINHTSLKLLAILESLLTLPVLVWMGYEIIGERNKRLGVIVGLSLALLVAVSYWHVSITRLALRIVLTPLVTALLLIFLSRAMRRNQRADFIKAGLVLGFGLYTYQAVRMLPVVVVIGIAIAFLFIARNWQERRQYLLNFLVLVWISFIVFIPLFHYSLEHPEQFWRRTAGRLLGDDIIVETLADGSIVERDASLQERIDAFNENIPVLMKNIRDALLMFNWKGDVAWINGLPNHPAMDTFSGALFILGLGAFVVLGIRERDPVYWLIPIMLFVMLLPSALSIAFPVENPSATRTSGAIPVAYLIAAFPLAIIIERMSQSFSPMIARGGAILLCSIVFIGAFTQNTRIYFNDFVSSYRVSSLPYSDAGRILEGFANSDGSYSNAFMIAYPYWWDHRAIAIASGNPDWDNGIVHLDSVPLFLYSTSLRIDEPLDVNRDLLFFYSVNDEDTADQLLTWFPEGRAIRYPSYQPEDEFMLYRVPALGDENFTQFLRDNNIVPS